MRCSQLQHSSDLVTITFGVSSRGRRGFTIMLKRLKPRSPILRVRTISSIFVSNYIFVLVQRKLFYYAANKDLYRTWVPNLSLTMYPFSISPDEHVP